MRILHSFSGCIDPQGGWCSLDVTLLQYVLHTWDPADMPQIIEVCLKHVGSPAFWPAALLTGQLQAFQWQSRNAALHSRL